MNSSLVTVVGLDMIALSDSEVRLPAGNVQALESGRVLCIGGWVVAVGISPSLFIVAQPRPQSAFPSPLLEQLVGFLVGRGAEVLRMCVRFPKAWHKSGKLLATVRFWAQEFLRFGLERRLFVALPPRLVPAICLPIVSAADSAVRFWREAGVLMTALGAEHPGCMPRVRIQLWELVRDWEQQWNTVITVAEASRNGISEDVRDLVNAADSVLANVVREHLEPHGYQMQPASMARLL